MGRLESVFHFLDDVVLCGDVKFLINCYLSESIFYLKKIVVVVVVVAAAAEFFYSVKSFHKKVRN